MNDQVYLGLLAMLPRNAWSRLAGRLSRLSLPGPANTAVIRAFAQRYQIDVDEAELPIEDYPTLNDFFTRRLKPGARPIAEGDGVVVSPADGRVMSFGTLDHGRMIQAKGIKYPVSDLLADDEAGTRFKKGSWLVVYLSPQNYHRVHHPVEGLLTAARYIPGHLWPVNRPAVQNIHRLFAINERLVALVDSPIGEVASIMVGATSVGEMSASFDASIRTNQGLSPALYRYGDGIEVDRGDELGIFHLGSTVVMLFDRADMDFSMLEVEQPVRMGQVVARAPG